MAAETGPSRRAIVIAGPTASGKSALALALAERFDGVVINADSMQVYRDLRILTARPSDADMARAPHRLFGHVDAANPYSVGRWLDEMKIVLDSLRAAHQTPIIVGGTGLYLRALVKGLSAIPPVPDDVRQRVRDTAQTRSASELHAMLLVRDPLTAAQLKATDPQRIIRALEVWEGTGTPLASFQRSQETPLLASNQFDGVFLAPPRPALRQRIDARFREMLRHGALAEVEVLAHRRLDPALPAMRSLGVPQLLAYLRGEIDLDSAADRSIALTSQYAKRQITFARHQLPTLRWIESSPYITADDLVSNWPSVAS